MKKLSKGAFDRAVNSIMEYARPLEQKMFLHSFSGGRKQDILEELKKYQNPDGGFGNGLEADFRMPHSSPKATAIGVGMLSRLDELEEARDMIKSAISYLESTYKDERKGWYIADKEINEYPHAPWWHFNESNGMTLLDLDWGNPSAEITAYLYKYREYVTRLNVEDIIYAAIEHLRNKKNFINDCTDFYNKYDKAKLPEYVAEFHKAAKTSDARGEVFSFLKLYRVLCEGYQRSMEESLKNAISQLVEYDNEKWIYYVPAPVEFVAGPNCNYLGIDKSKVEENLDFIIDQLELKGKMEPSWAPERRFYKDDLKPAYDEWIGTITLGDLLTLRSFGRV